MSGNMNVNVCGGGDGGVRLRMCSTDFAWLRAVCGRRTTTAHRAMCVCVCMHAVNVKQIIVLAIIDSV